MQPREPQAQQWVLTLGYRYCCNEFLRNGLDCATALAVTDLYKRQFCAASRLLKIEVGGFFCLCNLYGQGD